MYVSLYFYFLINIVEVLDLYLTEEQFTYNNL